MYNRLDRISLCVIRTDGQTSCHSIACTIHTQDAVRIESPHSVRNAKCQWHFGVWWHFGVLVCVNVYSMTEIGVDVVLNALVSCDLIHKVCVGL